MKLFSIFILTFSFNAFSGHFKLDKSILNARDVNFIPHSGEGKWDNYLALNLEFSPAADVFKQLLIKQKTQLTSRGEAHITILAPNDYWNILRPVGITIEEINELATKAQIQSIKFKPLCLGQSSALVDGGIEKTFYIVVESQDIIEMRKAIKKLYISRGGDSSKFLVEANYHPHITIGFTKRDLHENDKVVKNKKTCIIELDLI